VRLALLEQTVLQVLTVVLAQLDLKARLALLGQMVLQA
jgi:hypothetical protein